VGGSAGPGVALTQVRGLYADDEEEDESPTSVHTPADPFPPLPCMFNGGLLVRGYIPQVMTARSSKHEGKRRVA
jgi:hypothetical protein